MVKTNQFLVSYSRFLRLFSYLPEVVVEFNSRAVEQPFLDPSIMQKRIEAEKQWKAEQEKSSKAEGNPQGR